MSVPLKSIFTLIKCVKQVNLKTVVRRPYEQIFICFCVPPLNLLEAFLGLFRRQPLSAVRCLSLYKLSEVSGQGTAFTWPWGPDPHLCRPYSPSSSHKDRRPLSRALNPPSSAPLQHINSGTGTNCPTLDVLETQIASAASAPQTPQHSTPNRRKPSKEESQNCWFLCPVFA